MSARLRLPRTTPAPGTIQALLVIKTSQGTKLELVGTYDEKKALACWKALHKAELPGEG